MKNLRFRLLVEEVKFFFFPKYELSKYFYGLFSTYCIIEICFSSILIQFKLLCHIHQAI